jgi:hypothetical protein
LTYQWGIVSGSGVSLSSTNTASTKATFTAAGTFTFRVTAYDGQLSSTDDVVVIVNAPATTNKAPAVNAGADQTIALPATATLTATASDDGLPNNGTLTYQWGIVSGSGVSLSSTNTASTKATFTAAGTFTFRVTAYDGQLYSTDDVVVIANAPATTNKAPAVNAGTDQTIALPATATLTATASDDGPNTALTYQWTLISGTGASINNPTLSSVQVSFTAAGTYTFRVTVSDGQFTASDEVTVVATAAATSNLTLALSKSGTTIGGPITPVYVQTDGKQVLRLELLIDGQVEASTTGTSLTYRWKTNKVKAGSHTLKANAYVGQVIVATKTLIVTK